MRVKRKPSNLCLLADIRPGDVFSLAYPEDRPIEELQDAPVETHPTKEAYFMLTGNVGTVVHMSSGRLFTVKTNTPIIIREGVWVEDYSDGDSSD